jgi:hypothetical protein
MTEFVTREKLRAVATGGAGPAYLSIALEFTPFFRVVRSLVFCGVFLRSLFIILLLGIVLTVLIQFTVTDYPFGNLKLFFE